MSDGTRKTTICPRKAHKKSRKGCAECKRRHIKCDESHPKCVNCDVSRRHCSYEEMVSKAHDLVQRPRPGPTNKWNRRVYASPPRTPDATVNCPPVNTLHLELFHHFISDLAAFFGLGNFICKDSAIDITKCALRAPFLMNQILAFSALHLSIIRPETQKFHYQNAAQLQTHALSEFNNAKLDITSETCVPMFLFSSVLAMHVLCNSLLFPPENFEGFLAQFIQSLRMHRGVRAVTNQSWPLLLESPLKSFLESEGMVLSSNVTENECAELLSLVDTALLEPGTRSIYRCAIEDLQKAFNGSRTTTVKPSAVGPIISWPVTIPPGYIDLLSERRPEALAILSHYSVLLHAHKEVWLFGDSGLYIISSINKYLGPSWASWLRWPNGFLEEN